MICDLKELWSRWGRPEEQDNLVCGIQVSLNHLSKYSIYLTVTLFIAYWNFLFHMTEHSMEWLNRTSHWKIDIKWPLKKE